jgi:hypothetical protein
MNYKELLLGLIKNKKEISEDNTITLSLGEIADVWQRNVIYKNQFMVGDSERIDPSFLDDIISTLKKLESEGLVEFKYIIGNPLILLRNSKEKWKTPSVSDIAQSLSLQEQIFLEVIGNIDDYLTKTKRGKREKPETKTNRFNEGVLKTERLLNELEKDINKRIAIPKVFKIQVKDRYVLVNNYLLSKPHAVGTNFEFFSFIRRQPPNSKITKQNMPDWLKNEVGSKRFIKLLNELGFKGELLKAYFPKRGKNIVAYKGDRITKKELEKAGIRIDVFMEELKLAHIKNSPK